MKNTIFTKTIFILTEEYMQIIQLCNDTYINKQKCIFENSRWGDEMHFFNDLKKGYAKLKLKFTVPSIVFYSILRQQQA